MQDAPEHEHASSVRNVERLLVDECDTPLGPMTLASDGDSLLMLEFADCVMRIDLHLNRHYPTTRRLRVADPGGFSTRVRAYFNGDFDALAGAALAPAGSAFQRRAWMALRALPRGSTTTYADLAVTLGMHRNAARSVGAANGANPIAIAIPCHRVVGAGGRLTGYAGGLDRKRWLLTHEGALP